VKRRKKVSFIFRRLVDMGYGGITTPYRGIVIADNSKWSPSEASAATTQLNPRLASVGKRWREKVESDAGGMMARSDAVVPCVAEKQHTSGCEKTQDVERRPRLGMPIEFISSLPTDLPFKQFLDGARRDFVGVDCHLSF
jgi:hypothetical protein